MQKITVLVKRNWYVEIVSTSQKWYSVGFSHITWGEVSSHAETLTEAINEAYQKALDLEGLQ